MTVSTISRVLCVLCVLCGGALVSAQTRVTLSVQETAGIRRTQFPVAARVPLPQGALRNPARSRLILGANAVPAQPTADTRWPDGSVRELVVDFNASPGPNETQTFTLEYGESVTSEAPARGLTLTEDADGVQVGNMRFSRKGAPLVASVKYRDEAIAAGANGLIVVDASGAERDLSTAQNLTFEIVKRGPLVAAIRYTGTLPLDGTATASVSVVVEMPSSKSWVKIAAHVDDPSRRVKEIAIATPLALGALPWTWDLGTPRWTYGSLRNATDSVVLTSNPATRPAPWSVVSGPKGREQPFETAPGATSSFAGWGHLQGAREVVAFAIDHAPEWTGTTRVALDGTGQTRFTLATSQPSTRHDIVVYEHFVATPVQIGAATSPAAILSPLIVAVKP